MSSIDIDSTDLSKWDPQLTERLMGVIRPIVKRWFRSEVRGLDSFPLGGALVVSNHSGGLLPMDVPVFAVDFYERFGYDRPIFTLTHDFVFRLPKGEVFGRIGNIRATRDNAANALRSGGVVVVFPGGDYDASRPTVSANTIDFDGRTGYVKTAIEAGVPIVPAVSIGGQEAQIFLSRGEWLARQLGLQKVIRSKFLPLSFGFPFGPSVGLPINLPLPTKIVTHVLDPIDVIAEFGEDADPAAVDAHVRATMQKALDELAAQRRYPVLG